MKPLYLSLLQVGIGFLEGYINTLGANNVSPEVSEALGKALQALRDHKADTMTKQDWESLRG